MRLERKEKLEKIQETVKTRKEFWEAKPYATGVGLVEQHEFRAIWTVLEDIIDSINEMYQK